MIKMVDYHRITVCAFLIKGGWVAKYVSDYMGESAAFNYGKVLPMQLAKKMFPDLAGRYNPPNE